ARHQSATNSVQSLLAKMSLTNPSPPSIRNSVSESGCDSVSLTNPSPPSIRNLNRETEFDRGKSGEIWAG
ncbi:MAG TPA: hypothetical protein PLD59_13835, partial [Tepidisphaeraceae bacterium]|nr:hypothetical protein [Tepidisphaeraceae bacterium]